MSNKHSEIIQFLHSRFLCVSSLALLCDLSHTTLSRCMFLDSRLNVTSWAKLRHTMITNFAHVLNTSGLVDHEGWFFGPDIKHVCDGWAVYALAAPLDALLIFEYQGHIKHVQVLPVPKMQPLEETLAELKYWANIWLQDNRDASNGGHLVRSKRGVK